MTYKFLLAGICVLGLASCKTTDKSSYLSQKAGAGQFGMCGVVAQDAVKSDTTRNLAKLYFDRAVGGAAKFASMLAVRIKALGGQVSDPSAFAESEAKKMGLNDWNKFASVAYQVDIGGKKVKLGDSLATELNGVKDPKEKQEFMAKMSAELAGLLVEAHFDRDSKQKMENFKTTSGFLAALDKSTVADVNALGKILALQLAAVHFVGTGDYRPEAKAEIAAALRAVDGFVRSNRGLSNDVKLVIAASKASVFTSLKAIGIDSLDVNGSKMDTFVLARSALSNNQQGVESLLFSTLNSFKTTGEALQPRSTVTQGIANRYTQMSNERSALNADLQSALRTQQGFSNEIKLAAAHEGLVTRYQGNNRYLGDFARSQAYIAKAAASRAKN